MRTYHKNYTERVCPECGCSFKPHSMTQKFCSADCRRSLNKHIFLSKYRDSRLSKGKTLRRKTITSGCGVRIRECKACHSLFDCILSDRTASCPFCGAYYKSPVAGIDFPPDNARVFMNVVLEPDAMARYLQIRLSKLARGEE